MTAPSTVARQDPKQDRLVGLQRPQRVQADGRLGAGAAYESIDSAVATDDRRIAGPDAGRVLGADNRRLDEGSALRGQLLDLL